MKKLLYSLLFIGLITLTVGFTTNITYAKQISVGLAFDNPEGLGDYSFNDMMYKGLVEASNKFGVNIMFLAPIDYSKEAIVEELEKLVGFGSDIIIAGGFKMIDGVIKVAKKHPDKHFVILDVQINGIPNITSVLYAQREGAFVVGALAGNKTKTKKVGFIGGVDIDVVKDFLNGFHKGIRYISKEVSIEAKYCSHSPDYSGFSNPRKAYKLADKMYKSGVDIIFAVAGASGNGVMQAARKNKKFVIGVDSDQDYMAKGYVLTSMMKRLDNSIVNIVKEFKAGTLRGNYTYIYDYKNGGVSTTNMEFTKDIIGEKVITQIRDIEAKIISGELKVK